MKRVIWLLAILLTTAQVSANGDHQLYEGVQRCVDLVGEIKQLGNEGNTDVEKYIAKLTQDLRKQEYVENCTNVTTIPAVYNEVCSNSNSFCETVKILFQKELVE